MNLDELRAFLTEKAEIGETMRYENDDFVAYDWFGGNMDDAYDGGLSDGEVCLARELLNKLDA